MTLDEKLIALAKWVLREHRDWMADINGADIQEKACELGLLVWKTVDAPCGDACTCAEMSEPPYTCLFLCEGLIL